MSKKLSYTTSSYIFLAILSFVLARFWTLSGWWLTTFFVVFSSVVLVLANYKDKNNLDSILRGVAVAFALLGLRLASLGGGVSGTMQSKGYNVTGAILMFVGGSILGYMLSLKRGKSKK